MALYVSFSHRRIHNDLVPVQFGLRIFPTGTFLGLIEKQLHIQSIQSVASCVPKLFKILIKINMRVIMIFCFHFLFLCWVGSGSEETLLLGKIVARLLFITFIIFCMYLSLSQSLYMHYKPWSLDGVARILIFLKGVVTSETQRADRNFILTR